VKIDEAIATLKDSMTARRVYAEPVERDGQTVIAAAAVAGGGGGGDGTDPAGKHGSGGGFGLNAKPVGAFVITDQRVSWRPALDVNRLITVAGAVAIVALIVGSRRRNRCDAQYS
jgi:uncharacterized spore protein YtfJ